jgi:hypothetical protein
MKRIFTLALALMSMFAAWQMAYAANVTFSVTTPSPTYQCWIVGNFNGWNNNQYQLTKVDDTHYTITLDDATFAAGVTVDNLEYKYCSGGGDWAYVEKYADGSEMKANRAYKLGVTNTHSTNGVVDDTSAPGTNGVDVVLKWALVYNPTVLPLPKTVTVNALVPVGTIQCYIVGNFNGWTIPTDTTKMTKVEETPDYVHFRATFFTEDANKLQYKFCAGPAWDYEQTRSANFVYQASENEVTEVVEGFKKIYDPSKVGTITITATVPVGTNRVWIQGSALGWNWGNAIEATKNIDGTFTVAVPNVLSMEYRMYNQPDWDHPEVGEADPTKELSNRVANYPADATTSITVWGWKAQPDAVPQINMDKYRIYSNNHTLVVEGVTSQVEVVDITGRILQNVKMMGTFTSEKLNAGLYILRVDGATRKVSLR